jgi:mannose-1-phosphate guanylyltransferase
MAQDVWVVLLAGGSGTRVRSLTRRSDGRSVPKQFWPVSGRRTMLDWTIERALRLAPPERILCVVAREHARWWKGPLRALPAKNVLVQPADKGTGVGILYPLSTILARDPAATVVVLPCDHFVGREDLLDSALERAVEHARAEERVVLLGAVPSRCEEGCGWIVPSRYAVRDARGVERFVEKPEPARVAELIREGALINTFILCAAATVLLRLYERAVPRVTSAFTEWCSGRADERLLLGMLYRLLPPCDCSRDVLQQVPDALAVVPLPAACGWVDLGTPERLEAFVATNAPLRSATL